MRGRLRFRAPSGQGQAPPPDPDGVINFPSRATPGLLVRPVGQLLLSAQRFGLLLAPVGVFVVVPGPVGITAQGIVVGDILPSQAPAILCRSVARNAPEQDPALNIVHVLYEVEATRYARSVNETGIVGTGWTNEANALNAEDGAFAQIARNTSVGGTANQGTLDFSYLANSYADKNQLTIQGLELQLFYSAVRTALSPGGYLEVLYRFGGSGLFQTALAWTDGGGAAGRNEQFLVNPLSIDLSAQLPKTWADLAALQVRVRGGLDPSPVLGSTDTLRLDAIAIVGIATLLDSQ